MWLISFLSDGTFSNSNSGVSIIDISVGCILIGTALLIVRLLLINVPVNGIDTQISVLFKVRSRVFILAALALSSAILLWQSWCQLRQDIWALNSCLTNSWTPRWRYLGRPCSPNRCFYCWNWSCCRCRFLRWCCCLSLWCPRCLLYYCICCYCRLRCCNCCRFLRQTWSLWAIIFICSCGITVFPLSLHSLFLCCFLLFPLLSGKLDLDPIHSPEVSN